MRPVARVGYATALTGRNAEDPGLLISTLLSLLEAGSLLGASCCNIQARELGLRVPQVHVPPFLKGLGHATSNILLPTSS